MSQSLDQGWVFVCHHPNYTFQLILEKMRWPKIGWGGWIFPWKLNDTKMASTFNLRETEIPIFNEKINGISSHNSRASRPERRLLFNSRNWKPQLLRSWKGSKMRWTYLHKDVGKINNMVNDGSWSMPRHGWLICYWREWLVFLWYHMLMDTIPLEPVETTNLDRLPRTKRPFSWIAGMDSGFGYWFDAHMRC